MKSSMLKGVGFGLTSGIITTLGLIIGLFSSTHSKGVVLGGIIIIAIADGFSDALGIHISEESNSKNEKKVWNSTLWTFISKLVVALSFIIPILLFSLFNAVLFSILWGLMLIAVFSYYIAKRNKKKPIGVITEHIAITLFVIVTTYYIGIWISSSAWFV
jgi:vacuolar iron transporter family protein